MKSAIYRKTWFWLMTISVQLTVIIWLHLAEGNTLKETLRTEVLWVAIGSIGTLVSVIVAAFSVRTTEKTKIKQETYNAYRKFKNDAYDQENRIEDYDISDILKRYDEIREKEKNIDTKENRQESVLEEQAEEKQVKEYWTEIKKYLINVEYIATCANAGVFDIQTIYNMGGPYMIRQYDRLLPIIYYKRAQERSDGVYEEFEKMVKSLRKIDAGRK